MKPPESLAPKSLTAVVQRTIAPQRGSAPSARSDDVKVSQVGYPPRAAKVAMLTAATDGPTRVRRAGDDSLVRTVAPGGTFFDADSGDYVRPIDFSDLTDPGTYYLDVPGVGASDAFRIGDDVFARPLRLAMRMFTGQRCGAAVDLGPDFAQYGHAPCHMRDAQFHESSGRDGRRACPAGWHDAGDYGRYIVNSGITTGTLLWAWELNQPALRGLHLDLPESGGPLPDFLAEVRWNLRWMMSMQDEDGGAWHKATGADFAGACLPQDDTTQQLVVGSGRPPFKTTGATALLAAVCACAARVYKPFDAALAEECLDAARRAWRWLSTTPDHPFARNPPGIKTGGYGDKDLAVPRLWAAAELFRTTHDAAFDGYFLARHANWQPAISDAPPQSWADVRNLAMWCYALAPHGWVDAPAVERIRAHAIAAADKIVGRIERHPYRVPMRGSDYVWGSNSVAANYAVMLLLANRFAPKAAYVAGARDILHYLLGRNTFATSFVTHVGSRYPMHPHHRPSMADGVREPWPGMLVGGPNADGRSPPARQWFDDVHDYKTNEVAINWNAPLVFLLSELQA